MKSVFERLADRLGPALPYIIAATAACGFALASAAHAEDRDDYSSDTQKSVSCASNDGRRHECPANLRGYTVRDVDQQSRTECVVGRNWGYDDRGVWVDEGCRATFLFDNYRGGDHPRSWGYHDRDYNPAEEQRVRCESENGRRNECDADLRGYRIADVHELSRADCDIGRNFGYDDRGVWVDGGCRAEFLFTRDRYGRYSDRDHDRDFDRR
jgi:DUF3011 family protein